MKIDVAESQIYSGIPERTVVIIFGASGDLTRRKLMPAFYHLSREGLLPQKMRIIGLGRRILLEDEFISHMKNRVIQYCTHKMEDRFWLPIADNMFALRADFKEDSTFETLISEFDRLEKEWGGPINKLFYLATSPSHFEIVLQKMIQFRLHEEIAPNWVRVIVEKPFGLDLQSSDSLNRLLLESFHEDQIFRIDHFLGKEAVQNILIFRMSNLLFQPVWNREFIDHIQISIAETVGVEGRVDFFEQTGAIRDMIQSHILQILAFLMMEHPSSLDPEIIRDEKVILLRAVRPFSKSSIQENVIRAQYSEGVVNSQLVPAYRDEEGVKKESLVETYAAIKLFVDNYRWRGVPIYLRTGKRMGARKTEIIIQLKEIDSTSMPTVLGKQRPIPNTIRIEIQPRAGVELTIGWKPPGLLTEVESTSLTLGAKAQLKEPKAYERLLLDVMRGDSTLFIRYDEIREMWKIVDPIIKYWEKENKELKAKNETLPSYPAGTQGPRIAKAFIERDNRSWNKL